MKRVNYCTTLVQWIFTVYFLSQAIMATAGAVCLDSTDTFAVNSGVNASLPFNASNDENLNDFRVYRAQKNSMEFAHMTKDKSKGDCSGSLSDLCVKGKVEFRRDNQTHLLLVEIFHTTINDSGQYAVWAKFNSGNLHPDEKTAKCLKVIHVKVEGNSTETTTSPFPQSTQVYSPSSSSETTSPAPQSTQVYSPSSSSETTTSPVPQSTQVYSSGSNSENKASPVPQSTQVYSPSSSSGPGGKTVGIVLGVLLPIAFVITAGLSYYFKCRKKPTPSKSIGSNGEEMAFTGVQNNSEQMAHNEAPTQPDS